MIKAILEALKLTETQSGVCAGGRWIESPGGSILESINPTNGTVLGRVKQGGRADYEKTVEAACAAFPSWRNVPPPARGELVRRMGQELRRFKAELGLLVTLETGKIRAEGEGEVQEMIDMCDFAVGISRQLHGLTIASERPAHRMFEQWHPLGPIGIITAFNFPVAVWAWNAMIAAACGDTMIWKPSPETPFTALAVHRIVESVASDMNHKGVFNLCIGSVDDVGEAMIADARLPLISATGSTRMGRRVSEVVARRLGRSLLELGGNNAVIVTPSANLDLALRAGVFAAVGTAGQRCTTLRRLIVHESVIDRFIARLVSAYDRIQIGDPAEEGTLMGPLIHERAVEGMMAALRIAEEQGGQVLRGGTRLDRPGFFVTPAIVRAHPGMAIVGEETFAPILYVMSYKDLNEAIAIQNGVEQGLSSAIFSDHLTEIEAFLAASGSDCGIANVNIGTSGAEIGGAFGGEKATGGGREAGSDAWKFYMRRQTCTINGGGELPLAQGIRFDFDPAEFNAP